MTSKSGSISLIFVVAMKFQWSGADSRDWSEIAAAIAFMVSP
jgi:hypothetical protein